ncbi:MAG: hypothetical protein ACR2HM_09905 [Acidimicrobiales bacterium]
MRRPLSALSASLVLLAVLAGCSPPAPVAGRLTVDGQAEILRPGEDRRDVTGSRDLELGDRVRVRQGSAVISLRDDRRLELRAGSDIELRAADGTATVLPSIIGGDLLVVSKGQHFAIAIAAANAEVVVLGDSRISRGVAVLVATYKGSAELKAGGATLAVPALRQAALPPTGQFPTSTTPLEFSGSDAWDLRYLSDAMDLSNQLAGRSSGFSSQLSPTEGRSATYFRDLLPQLADEPSFTADLVSPARSPGDTLVGAAIALVGADGSFAERWAAVFGFRDQGAAWGLVALDQGVSRVPLLATLDGAIRRAPAQFAAGPPPSRPLTSLNPPNNQGATTVPPAIATTSVPRPRPGATTTTTAPATTGTTGTTSVGPLNTGTPLDDTVNALVKTLTGLLNSLGQQ